MANRTTRGYPTRWGIACYWADQEMFDVELTWPHCFACGLEAPVIRDPDGSPAQQWRSATLERAHLHDAAWGGGLEIGNFVLLCRPCHKLMPSFKDRESALAWVQRGWPLAHLIADYLAGLEASGVDLGSYLP